MKSKGSEPREREWEKAEIAPDVIACKHELDNYTWNWIAGNATVYLEVDLVRTQLRMYLITIGSLKKSGSHQEITRMASAAAAAAAAAALVVVAATVV